MYKLVIAEKPSVAKSIASVLGAGKRENGYVEGNGYLVSWCFGHLAEFASADVYDAKYEKWNYADLPIVPDPWEYAVSRDKVQQFNLLKSLMSRGDVSEVINACDAGREGEAIFRTVYNLSGCKKPMKRLWISSMEDAAIQEGFDNLRDGKEYDNLFTSALCRSKADLPAMLGPVRMMICCFDESRCTSLGTYSSPGFIMVSITGCLPASISSERLLSITGRQ